MIFKNFISLSILIFASSFNFSYSQNVFSPNGFNHSIEFPSTFQVMSVFENELRGVLDDIMETSYSTTENAYFRLDDGSLNVQASFRLFKKDKIPQQEQDRKDRIATSLKAIQLYEELYKDGEIHVLSDEYYSVGNSGTGLWTMLSQYPSENKKPVFHAMIFIIGNEYYEIRATSMFNHVKSSKIIYDIFSSASFFDAIE